MRYGILSDTHGAYHPEIDACFAGVNEIFHAGDVGNARVLDALEGIAPVRAVRGNMDGGDLAARLRDREVLTREGKRIVLLHGHLARAAKPALLFESTRADRPDLVIFGHTHHPLKETFGGVVFFNPGAAGKPRFGHRPSIGLLEITGEGMRLQHRALSTPFPAR
ncbi:MAG: metallophosphoesterase [Gemmatimonadota bacterium]